MRLLSELRGMTTCPFCSAHRNATVAGDAPLASAMAVTVSCASTGFSRCPRIIHWLPSVLYASYCHPSAVQNSRTSASALNTSELRCTTAGATTANSRSSISCARSKLLTPMDRILPAATSASIALQLSRHVPSGSAPSHSDPQHRG